MLSFFLFFFSLAIVAMPFHSSLFLTRCMHLSTGLLARNDSRLGSQTIAVTEKQDTLAVGFRLSTRLDPLAHARAAVHGTDETKSTTLCIRLVVFAHDGLDGLGGLVSVVKGDGADVVVENMGLDDAVEQVTANEAHLTIDGRGGTANKIPFLSRIVREGRIGVLQESNGH
jgi:hypothetical protein